jgi:hypothetical protein
MQNSMARRIWSEVMSPLGHRAPGLVLGVLERGPGGALVGQVEDEEVGPVEDDDLGQAEQDARGAAAISSGPDRAPNMPKAVVGQTNVWTPSSEKSQNKTTIHLIRLILKRLDRLRLCLITQSRSLKMRLGLRTH